MRSVDSERGCCGSSSICIQTIQIFVRYTLANAHHLHEERELRELQAAVHVEVCDLERPAPELLFQVLRGQKARSSMVGTHWFLHKRPATKCAWDLRFIGFLQIRKFCKPRKP